MLDEGLALAGDDSNPFNWTGGTRAGIGFLWSYPGVEGPQRQVTYTRLSDLLATPHRRVTFPYIPRAESDENTWKRLKGLAENEMILRREHCVYLGIQLQRERYEEDPSKWPRSSGGTKSTVYYEWTNVLSKTGNAYRTAIEAHHLLHHSRGPPKGPLSSTCLLYTSPSPRDLSTSRMPSSA